MTSALRFDASGAALELGNPWRETPRPGGDVLGANAYYLTYNGYPFPVVSGELIMQRYPRNEWGEAIASLKASGCTMVSSYLFWSLVEPNPGQFDFTGNNDIRVFAELCAEQGMLFSPRIGPFNNSEFLLGGLPPWLYGMPFTERSNDAGYLERVQLYFTAVGRELDQLYWQDGGPVVMVQLENELSHAPNDWSTLFGYTATDHRGPEGVEFTRHMDNLRDAAVAAGIDPPFFSMTGWGTAGAIPDSFIPSYGGYMDLHYRPGPNSRLTMFTYGDYPHRGSRPVIFSELGTGSPTRAAYRSMSATEMATTTALTRLGGVETTFLGYYLFHGGTNPVRGDGFGWTMKEPEFAVRSYDFWAPFSEFGEPRPSSYTLNAINRFVQDFGSDLAPMQVIHAEDPVTDPDDDRLRATVRSDGDSGFVFLSNYGNHTPMSPRDDVHLRIRLRDSVVEFPQRMSLPVESGAELIAPVNLRVGHVTVTAATSWPLARLHDEGCGATLVAAARQDAAEYLFAGVSVNDVHADGAEIADYGSGCVVVAPAGTTIAIHSGNRTSRIVTLAWEEGLRLQSFDVDGKRTLAASREDFRGLETGIEIRRLRPLGDTGAPAAELVTITPDGGLRRTTTTLPSPSIGLEQLHVQHLSPSRVVIRARGDVGALSDLWLDVAYDGDVCRLFDIRSGTLIADDLNRGIPWRMKLGRFSEALAGAGLQVRVEPLAHKESVSDPAGILLDSVMRTKGHAEVRELAFSQLVYSAPLALDGRDG